MINRGESNIQETKEVTLINGEKIMGSRKFKTISKSFFKKFDISGNCFFICISYFFQRNQDEWRNYRRKI